MGEETRDIFKEEKKSLFPTPRDFQEVVHTKLREGYRNGHSKQMVCSATGSGKCFVGLRLINEAIKKGRRAFFVCDRTALINQTSETASRYGMAHGVIQADHWRRNGELFQIVSAQTLARRKFVPPDLWVIDEAQTQLKVWVDFIKNDKKNTAVVGLSATPFSKGLGKLFTNLINVRTTHELTQDGILVPMRVFSCVKPDMRGAETAGGEWTPEAAAKRELEIVGDVVTDWFKFGENRKTIAFGATIDHCLEIARQFNEAGVLAATYTSKTDDETRQDLLDEFKDPDSPLRILVSVSALAKGFDAPLVSCLARGSLVLTDRGEVEIQDVRLTDRVWDGVEFVRHDGAICKGTALTISYGGLDATEDHLVATAHGWMKFGECRDKGIEIVESGRSVSGLLDRRPVKCKEVIGGEGEAGNRCGRFVRKMRNYKNPVCRTLQCRQDKVPEMSARVADSKAGNGRRNIQDLEGCFGVGFAEKEQSGKLSSILRLCLYRVWRKEGDKFGGIAHRTGLRILQATGGNTSVACPQGHGHANKVYEQVKSCVQKLRRSWNKVQLRLSSAVRNMGHRESWPSGAGVRRSVGQDRQRWSLRAGELALGVNEYESLQYPSWRMGGEDAQVQIGAPGDQVRGQDSEEFIYGWPDRRTDNREVQQAIGQAEREVWDILNAGPRNRFTCQGLLVHNCVIDARPLRKSMSEAIQMWGRMLRTSPETGKVDARLLDHSGNIVRFAEDFEDFYYNGIASLDDGEKLDKEIRKDEQREERACPQCGHRPFVKRCVACGHESKSLSLIQHQPGEMVEITIGRDKKKAADSPEHLWAQLATYVRQSGKVETQRQRAFYLYRDIMGRSPPEHFAVGNAPVVDITPAVIGKIRSRQIAYSKGMQKGARRA